MKNAEAKEITPTLFVGKIDVEPKVESYEREMACGCGNGSMLILRPFSHITYTMQGEKVDISEITAYKCSDCNLVLYTPEVGDALVEAINNARNSRSRDL